jgi:hypothetical protein
MWVGHPNQGYIDNPAQFNSGSNYLKKVNEVRQVLENNNADVAWLNNYPGLNWVVSTFGDNPTYQRQLMKFAFTNGATGPMASGMHKDLDDQWDRRIAKGATELELFSDVMLSLGAPAAGLQGTSSLNYSQYATGTGTGTGTGTATEPQILPTEQGVGMGLGDPVPVTSTPGPSSEAGWSAYNKLLQDEYQDYLEEKSSHDALVQSGLDKSIYGHWNPPPVMDLSNALGKVRIDPVTGEQSLEKPPGYQAYSVSQPLETFQKQELESMPEPFDDAENEKRMKGMPYVTKQVDKKGKKIKGATFVPTIKWGIQHGFRDATGHLVAPDTTDYSSITGKNPIEAQNIAKAKALQAQKAEQLKIQGTNWGAAQGIPAGDIGKIMSSGVEDPYLTPYLL